MAGRVAKFHTWGEFNLEKKEVPMTHAEMPPRGHIPAYGVRNLAEGREVEIYPTALPHEPFNTVEYLSVQESQAREARAREEGRAEAFDEAFTMLRNDPRHPLTLESRLRDAAKAARAAASRSGEGKDEEREKAPVDRLDSGALSPLLHEVRSKAEHSY